MINRKYLMYGGIGAAVLLGGYMLLGSSGGGSDPETSGDGGDYYPPVVYGGGGGIAPGGAMPSDSYSTDNSLNQLLATQLQTATMQNNLSMAQLSAEREIALTGYETELQTTKIKADASIGMALASQLGNIASSMVSSKSSTSSKSGLFRSSTSNNSSVTGIDSVSGSLKYSNGEINVDLAKNVSPQIPAQQQQQPANNNNPFASFLRGFG